VNTDANAYTVIRWSTLTHTIDGDTDGHRDRKYFITSSTFYRVNSGGFHKVNDATSIPSQCCAVPYTLDGGLYYNCTVNTVVSSDLGCYNRNRHWVTCQQPTGTFTVLLTGFITASRNVTRLLSSVFSPVTHLITMLLSSDKRGDHAPVQHLWDIRWVSRLEIPLLSVTHGRSDASPYGHLFSLR